MLLLSVSLDLDALYSLNLVLQFVVLLHYHRLDLQFHRHLLIDVSVLPLIFIKLRKNQIPLGDWVSSGSLFLFAFSLGGSGSGFFASGWESFLALVKKALYVRKLEIRALT